MLITCVCSLDRTILRESSHLLAHGARINDRREGLLQADLVLGRFTIHGIIEVYGRQILVDIVTIDENSKLAKGGKRENSNYLSKARNSLIRFGLQSCLFVGEKFQNSERANFLLTMSKIKSKDQSLSNKVELKLSRPRN